ncbi:MAG: hypothetical protein ACK8QZ_09015 [Anaerolineales bacterium]
MNIWFFAAGVAAVFIALIHVALGGRETARPTLAAGELPSLVRYTNYYCWHMVTLSLGLVSAAFLYAALPARPPELAAGATFFAAGAAILCLGMNVRFRLKHAHHPQWMLFLPVAALGGAGLWL